MAKWLKKVYTWLNPSPERRQAYREGLRKLYLVLNKYSGGALGVLRHCLTNFSIARAPEASAALSYYAIFSIFPILLVIVTVASFFVEQEVVRFQLLDIITQVMPISTVTVNEYIDAVLQARGAVTLFALLSLLWSASNVFDRTILNINRAFPQGQRPGFFQSRAMALAMLLALFVLFVLSLGIDALIEVVPALDFKIMGTPLTQTTLWGWLAILLPLLMKFLLFLGVYTWVPRSVHLHPRARVVGSLVAAVLWDLVTYLLTWSIASGFTDYKLVYGSLGSIIALLFWLYLSAYILFFGAHLVNAINYQIREKAEAKLKRSEEAPA